MSKLTVVASASSHCVLPGVVFGAGNVCQYVGRVYNPESKSYDIDRSPSEFHDDGSVRSKYVKKLIVRGELLAYDQDTAIAAGVPYVPRRFETILKEWVEDTKKASR